jgi:hypothetical protein
MNVSRFESVTHLDVKKLPIGVAYMEL